MLAAYREAIRHNPGSWSNYSDLGDWLLQSGNVNGAARAYKSYPGFNSRRPDPADVVAMSDDAFDAGSGLYWRGAIESARKLYEIAANNHDGSYASIESAGRLALLRGDLQGICGRHSMQPRDTMVRLVRYIPLPRGKFFRPDRASSITAGGGPNDVRATHSKLADSPATKSWNMIEDSVQQQ